MRVHSAALGDFVPGRFVVPQNPVVIDRRQFGGLGEFVPARFALPQRGLSGMGQVLDDWCEAGGWDYYSSNYGECVYDPDFGLRSSRGLNGVGCGCGGGCGGRCGMGAVDLSLTGTGIVSSLSTSLGVTSLPTIPNWAVYGVGGLLAYMAFAGGKRRRGR